METIRSVDDIENLEDNRVVGIPEITNSNISFKGYNNVLYCEGDLIILDTMYHFYTFSFINKMSCETRFIHCTH